jgi:ubiquitin-protein ligase
MNKRIMKELKTGATSEDFDFLYDENGKYGEVGNCYVKFAVCAGTYAGQIHIMRYKFMYGSNQSYSFPRDPPNVTFETPIWHPNISTNGSICLDVIKSDKWSPMYNIETIFHSIIALLESPNTSSPFNTEAAKLYNKYCGSDKNHKSDMETYVSMCANFYHGKIENMERIKMLLGAPEFDMNLCEKLASCGITNIVTEKK